jgi:hypothetical protein
METERRYAPYSPVPPARSDLRPDRIGNVPQIGPYSHVVPELPQRVSGTVFGPRHPVVPRVWPLRGSCEKVALGDLALCGVRGTGFRFSTQPHAQASAPQRQE